MRVVGGLRKRCRRQLNSFWQEWTKHTQQPVNHRLPFSNTNVHHLLQFLQFLQFLQLLPMFQVWWWWDDKREISGRWKTIPYLFLSGTSNRCQKVLPKKSNQINRQPKQNKFQSTHTQPSTGALIATWLFVSYGKKRWERSWTEDVCTCPAITLPVVQPFSVQTDRLLLLMIVTREREVSKFERAMSNWTVEFTWFYKGENTFL